MELGIGVECALGHAIESVVLGVVMHSWTWTLLFVLMLGVVESYLFIYLLYWCVAKKASKWDDDGGQGGWRTMVNILLTLSYTPNFRLPFFLTLR
jgi:hypothetical protein